jgi:chemotaxis protein MotB
MRLLAIAVTACGGSKPEPAKPAEPPKPDPRIDVLERELANIKDAYDKEHDAAEQLRKEEAARADETKKLQDQLANVVGKAGEVTTADGAVRLELVDQILFPTGEADLTPSGKDVLAKVGAALKEADKQIWVQGHTDDQPILVKPPPKKEPEKPKKNGKNGKKEKEPPKPPEKNDAVLAYTTNWELSAARALTVVHYLQDEAKLEPSRLAAVAFGQYRPTSKNRAKNRRIEIVLYPRSKLSPK